VAEDSVEREVFIEAAPEVVWQVLTESEHIRNWFSDEAEVDGRAGAEGTLTWKPGGRGGAREADMVVPILVVDAEPFRRFCFRWNHPEGILPDESNSALVEFSLDEEAGGTRLRVVESGIRSVTREGEERARYVEQHERGWGRHLGEMVVYLASSQEGARP